MFVTGVRKRSAEGFAALWLASSLVIVSNLFFLIATNFGERLLYLPSVMVCYVAGPLLLRAARTPAPDTGLLRSPALVVPLAILLAAATTATLMRSFEWRDELTLLRADVRKYPSSAALNNYLGQQYYLAGERLIEQGASPDAAAESFANARQYLLRGLAINRDFSERHAVLGMAEYRLNQYEEALPHLQQSLAFPLYRPTALKIMADSYQALHNRTRALEVFRQIDAEGIADPVAWFELGNDAAA